MYIRNMYGIIYTVRLQLQWYWLQEEKYNTNFYENIWGHWKETIWSVHLQLETQKYCDTSLQGISCSVNYMKISWRFLALEPATVKAVIGNSITHFSGSLHFSCILLKVLFKESCLDAFVYGESLEVWVVVAWSSM